MGWLSAKLSQIVEHKKGKKPKRLEYEPFQDSLTYLDIRAIEKNVNEIFADPGSSTITGTDELVIVWDGARAGWVGLSRVGALGSTLMALRPKIDKLFIYRLLQSQFDYLHSNHRGTGIPHVDPDILWNISVPIPPLNEQQRIVSKLNSLFEKLETNKKRLEKIPQILKRFRQSVLAEAVNGNLTEDWRQKHGGDEEWSEVSMEQKASLITSGSRGWAKYYAPVGSTFIRAQNISNDFLDMTDIAYVKIPNKSEGSRTLVKQDDLLITITGANVTKSAHVNFEIDDAYVSQHVALLRLKPGNSSGFIFLFLISVAHGRKQLLHSAYGQGKPQLNLNNIRELQVILPPFKEQIEIVNRVNQLFSFADKIESRYLKAKAQLDKLPQSILAKAFRGELVPQDPDDEPANLLLERIFAAKRMKK